MSDFLNKIFPKYFTTYEKRSDTNKDANGKGTLERFNETIGKDIDDNIHPLIDALLYNTIDHKTCMDRYVPFLENEFAVTVRISNTLASRRAVLAVIQRLTTMKGTAEALRVLFGMMNLSVVITEYFNYWGFDSSETFDSAVRTFDSSCPACSDYKIELTGSFGSLNGVQLDAVYRIIAWNQPINATLRTITYNGNVPAGPDYNGDFNDDFNS